MQRKQILMLSIIAVGITIELIVMAAFIGSQKPSEIALLSTISIAEAGGNGQDTGGAQPGVEGTPLYDEDAPITDEELYGSGDIGTGDEPTPVFDFGDGMPEGVYLNDGSGDGSAGYEDLYPAPNIDDPYDDDGYFPDDDPYPAPPTLGPAPYEQLPTDVSAATVPAPTRTPKPPKATSTPVPPTAAPPDPTATQPGQQPTATDPYAPTATPPAAQQPTPTNQPQPTLADVSGNTLLAVRGDAPKLDGSAGDEVWKSAPVLKISTSGGANESAAQVSVRSVYSGSDIYFLFTWSDPSQSYLRAPWEKQKDGSWKQLASPDRVLNDENRYSEDMLSLMWPTRKMPDFTSQGCGTACHSGENSDVKPLGNMQAPDGGRADLWQWKSVRNSGQVDDLYLDDEPFTKDNIYAGRHADPSDGGGYRFNLNGDKDAPAYMPPGGGEKDGSPGYISESDKVKLDAKLFKAGERVPGILKAPFQGDRGDIAAAWRYKDGRWTLEVRRKLVTGSSHDVQFEDLSAAYPFALSTFDNTEVRHAAQEGAAELRFQK